MVQLVLGSSCDLKVPAGGGAAVRHVVRALEARGEERCSWLWYRAVSLGFEARDV